MSNRPGQGHCPICNGELDYDGAAEIVEESVKYPVKCTECDFEGYEWYTMEYDTHSREDGKDLDSVAQETEITVRIAKRLILARLNTLKDTIDRRYDEISNASTQYIYDEINEALAIVKSSTQEERTI